MANREAVAQQSPGCGSTLGHRMPFTIATLKALHTLLSTKDRCNIMQMRFVFGQLQPNGKFSTFH